VQSDDVKYNVKQPFSDQHFSTTSKLSEAVINDC